MVEGAYPEQRTGIWPLLRVPLQRPRQIITEHRAQSLRVGNLRRPVRSDEVQSLERVLVKVGRLAFDHLCEQASATEEVR